MQQLIKLYAFSTFFALWDKVIFIDAGLRVFDKIQYTRGRGEDYRLIRDISEAGMCVKFSKYATYLVRQNELTNNISDVKRHLEMNLRTISSCGKI